MRQLQPMLFFRRRSYSLFMRLIAGFLCIIVLLVSLTVYAISISKRIVKQEIVNSNTLMLDNAMNGYEKHLDLVKKQMYLFFSEEVQRLQAPPRYDEFPQIISDISTWVANPYLFIDNIVFVTDQGKTVLEKNTSTSARAMFGKFYASEAYPPDFWTAQFSEPYTYRVFPSASFHNSIFRGSSEPIGDLIPVVFKYDGSADSFMVVFLEAGKMYDAFQQSKFDNFAVYDRDGRILYLREGEKPFLAYDELTKPGKERFVRGDDYYFIRKGSATGYSYAYRVPAGQIAYQSRLSLTLITILAAAVLLSILIAVMFAVRINNPLKRVIESLRSMNEAMPNRSGIREFNLIDDELRGSRELRRQVGFVNRLKAIRSREADGASLSFSEGPFVFVLYQVQSRCRDSGDAEPIGQWLYYLKAYIDAHLQPAFSDAQTFQIERNQILSLVPTDRTDDLLGLLKRMKDVFEHDKAYGIVTIAVTPVHRSSDELTSAYEEAQQLVRERRLTDETQIIVVPPEPQSPVGLPPDQDKEFLVQLKEGNAQRAAAILQRLFDRWESDSMTAAALLRFAESTVGKIRVAAVQSPADPDRLTSILAHAEAELSRCETAAELERQLLDLVKEAAEAVKAKKEEKDAVTDFVIDYVNAHLSEAIYLDTLADKLKMSSSYLSTYFKGKTGVNIVDYINETRIARAKELLCDNRAKINDVAKTVGYQNITSFNRMFKKFTGTTPSEHRKREHSS
ncbi:helix-turn-helix domain-containing protein [Cohnella sp. GCM10020058]|uniref:helix-turn-helix domain-containing protein n=1 Tax=Cohnella sp. GCM10020058 TaxID=3317330 RepID=UPI00363B65C5